MGELLVSLEEYASMVGTRWLPGSMRVLSAAYDSSLLRRNPYVETLASLILGKPAS